MKGAIFDIDGTLLDSMEVWNNATLSFYKKRNLPFCEKEFDYFKSITLNESLPFIKEKYNLHESVEEIFAELEGVILNDYKYNIPLKPYADVYLRKLKAQGVKLAIATSTRPQFCIPAFERLEILNLFDAFAYSDEVKVNKSKPDIYLLAAKRINVPPSECMVFEDIIAGIKSAKAAGMATCAISDNTNFNETDELKEYADLYIKTWKELIL